MSKFELFEKNKYIFGHGICTLLCGLFFSIDLSIKLGYAAGFPYIIVLMLAMICSSRIILLFYAGLSTVLIFTGFYLSPMIDDNYSIAVANRIIAILVIWIVTSFCILFVNTRRVLEIVEENVHSVLNATPTALVMTNEEGNIELANQALFELFNYDRDQLIGQNIEILIPKEFRQQHQKDRANYNNKPKKRKMAERSDLYACTKDGRTFPVEVGLSPINLNQAPKVIAAILDITERKKQMQELQIYMNKLKKSNENLEQFAYIASHDLQEPLRMVSSYTQLLASRYQDKLDENANEFIKYSVDGAARMQTLIQDLLRFSRLGGGEVNKAHVDANELYDKALKNLTMEQSNETSAQVTRDKLPVIYGDKVQLGQLFNNLIGNAKKYSDPKRSNQIHVSAEQVDDKWQFCIQDNGIGIQTEHFERIFMIFKRLHGAHEYSGTGIGLALCKRIIDTHGGEIWVESEYGQGSRFYFTLQIQDC